MLQTRLEKLAECQQISEEILSILQATVTWLIDVYTLRRYAVCIYTSKIPPKLPSQKVVGALQISYLLVLGRLLLLGWFFRSLWPFLKAFEGLVVGHLFVQCKSKVSHLLCAACRGGVESNRDLLIEAELVLSDEWKRASVATQKIYQEIRAHDALVAGQMRQLKPGLVVPFWCFALFFNKLSDSCFFWLMLTVFVFSQGLTKLTFCERNLRFQWFRLFLLCLGFREPKHPKGKRRLASWTS